MKTEFSNRSGSLNEPAAATPDGQFNQPHI